MLNRRRALGLIAGGVACAAATRTAHQAVASEGQQSLAALAKAKGLLFGSAMGSAEMTPDMQGIFVREAGLITPSNELKLESLRPTPDAADFTSADALMDFADRHSMAVRGHTLVWNDYQPAWVKKLDKVAVADVMDRHIDLVGARYRGRIRWWDVVNEPIGTNSGEANWLSSGPYFKALGATYIARSLRRARAADPTAKLFLNETHTERDDAFGLQQRRRLLRLIDELRAAEVPLDGIGLQGHLEPPAPFKPDGFLKFLDELVGRGLEIHITELDVDDKHFPDDIAERDQRVASTLATFLGAALQCRSIKVLATWHLADHHSFHHREALRKNPHARRRPRPVLYDEHLQRKPAWHAVAQALSDCAVRV